MRRRLRILHAIHDFVPRHQAGSEIYAHDLATEQSRSHDVWVLAAEFDPSAAHGTIRWRRSGVLPVVELVNNWAFRHFDDTYASSRLNDQLVRVLAAIEPDVVHVHNLLNLSLDLPRLARERGAAVVATLHDYTLVCIAGGQRVHRAERHVCHEIDPKRCVRCFAESPFGLQLSAGRMTAGARMPRLLRIAAAVKRAVPTVVESAARAAAPAPLTIEDVRRRHAYAKHVFDMIDLFVAPSRAIADEYVRLGAPPDRVEVSAYGHAIAGSSAHPAHSSEGRVRIGYVGSIVWHKGLHVLLAAARGLRGNFRISVHGNLDIDPAYAKDLRAASEGLPVRFAGAFDRDKVAQVFSGIDVLVVPSLWPENAPLVVQEARRYGIPVVASRIGGLPEFVDDDVDGRLFAADSADQLRQVLQGLVDDRSQLDRLAGTRAVVKSVGTDAAEWERRYATLTNLDADSDLERRASAARPVGCDRAAEQAS